MRRKYSLLLTAQDRSFIQEMIRTGKASARKILRGRILLKADTCPPGPGWRDQEIASAFDVSLRTVSRLRRRYEKNGLADALNRREQKGRRPGLLCCNKLKE